MRKVALAIAALLLTGGAALAWSGTDQEGRPVEIGRGELVRPGLDVDAEVDGESRQLSIDSVRRSGGRVEIEATDQDGNSVTLDMDED